MTTINISPQKLTLGMYVRLPSGWMKHPFLLNSFELKDPRQIKIIQSLGLDYVVVDESKSAVRLDEPEPDSAEEDDSELLKMRLEQEKQQRIEKLKTFRRSLQKTEKQFDKSLAQVRSLMNKVNGRPLQAVQEAKELINNLVEVIMGDQGAILHLMKDNKDHQELYYHSLNVTVLALMLAKQMDMSKEDCQNLGLAALFHDVGKLKIPKQILNKKVALTRPEKNFLMLHCQYAVEMLQEAEEFPRQALPMIFQHHEYLDGSGYPRGLTDENILPPSQVLMLVNEYDNLCHPVDSSKARTPYSALSYLFKKMRQKLPEKALKMFIKLLGVYPPGTLVLLSEQQIGMVISVNSKDLLNPGILLYDPSVPRTEAPILDLKDSELSIQKALAPKQLPQKAYEYLNPRERISYFVDQAPS
ncbi:uncharacterized protein HMF8227_01100 [Saliniradius amylolyticus]|uniref:HD-GYP domain-containing protein n=1 Tax=Saliniradius amylolyticus TaxID=2183582 RepID=A0A2S2E1S3_9ALTE|nr:DUF3391 domain-containing protein [Saliniradius amylolyticus]AWL11586.1 uncharacterized protein HMF8227_01100 [Saliniradius amylolyticus]